MTGDLAMRLQLQKVAAYRELCRAVRRSGRENAVFAAIMMGLAYFAYQNGVNPLVLAIYGTLIVGELAVGLYKWFFPSAEGHLLDGIVLLVFAGVYLGVQFLVLQAGLAMNPVILFLGLFMLLGAVGRFKMYGHLRQLFAERPSAEHIAWFDGLVQEIRTSDPESDEQAIDLPTGPHWKAKLLGPTAFFIAMRGGAVWVAGPEDFEILREKADRGTGRRRAQLRLLGEPQPEFEIADASWANFSKWRATYPFTPIPAETPAAAT
jgi:hypothetical protein